MCVWHKPSVRSSAHATTLGEGPWPRWDIVCRRGCLDSMLGIEMTFSAALTILEVDLVGVIKTGNGIGEAPRGVYPCEFQLQ